MPKAIRDEARGLSHENISRIGLPDVKWIATHEGNRTPPVTRANKARQEKKGRLH